MQRLRSQLNKEIASHVAGLKPQVNIDNETAAELVRSQQVAMTETLLMVQQTLTNLSEMVRQQALAVNALIAEIKKTKPSETRVEVEAPEVVVERPRTPYTIELEGPNGSIYTAKVTPE